MKKVTEYIQNKADHADPLAKNLTDVADSVRNNVRGCPSCGMMSIRGMPGGPDSICNNCGYKDPCCYD